MAQAKANRTLPFFLGSTASGSAAEAIAGGFLLCSVCCGENANGSVVLSSRQLVSMWQGRQCSALSHGMQFIDRGGRQDPSTPSRLRPKKFQNGRLERSTGPLGSRR